MRNILKKIEDIRKKKGYTKTEFATKILDVTVRNYRRWTNGHVTPSRSGLIKLEEALRSFRGEELRDIGGIKEVAVINPGSLPGLNFEPDAVLADVEIEDQMYSSILPYEKSRELQIWRKSGQKGISESRDKFSALTKKDKITLLFETRNGWIKELPNVQTSSPAETRKENEEGKLLYWQFHFGVGPISEEEGCVRFYEDMGKYKEEKVTRKI